MIGLIITPEQVVELAFSTSDQITPAAIKKTKIDAAQEKFIRPALGRLYDVLIEGQYPELAEEYIRPALAYYVRYTIIPDLALKLNDKGALSHFTDHSNAATDKQRAEMRQQAKDDAAALLDKAIRHIEEHNDDFPEYAPNRNVRNKVSTNGLIL